MLSSKPSRLRRPRWVAPALLALAMLSIRAGASEREDRFCDRYLDHQRNVREILQKGWTKNPEQPLPGDSTEQGVTYRRGCLSLPWLDQAAEAVCGGRATEVRLPKEILFYFDGTGYFAPNLARMLGAVNLMGTEGSQLFEHGVRAFMSDWIPALEKNRMSWRADIEFHYHAGFGALEQGIENATACFRQINEALDDLTELRMIDPARRPKLVVMGHSVGGYTGLTFARNIGAPVDLLLMIDAVPEVSGFVFSKLTRRSSEINESAPANVKRVVNIYQKTDTGSLGRLLSVRGSEVSFADRQVDLRLGPDFEGGHASDHIRMLYVPETTAIIVEEIGKLVR